MIKKGAMTIAEGRPDYRTDANIAFGNTASKKDFVLRITYDDINVLKTKHSISLRGVREKDAFPQKWAAMIEKDCWVFGIDATKPHDLVAVKDRCFSLLC